MTGRQGRRRAAARPRKLEGPLFVTGATAVTMDAQRRIQKLDVRIEGGQMTALAENLSTQGAAQVIDGRGMILLPGFVQAHVHLCHSLLRGMADGMDLLSWQRERVFAAEGALTAEDVRVGARLGIAELLLGGTTTVLDFGTVRHTDVLFEEAERAGLRYIGGKAVMDHGHGYPLSLRETTAEAIAESVRLCERWHNAANGRLGYAFSPRSALTTTDDAIRGLVSEARQRHALLHTHAAEDPEEVAMVRERVKKGTVEYLHALGMSGGDVLLAHGIWLSSEERRILRESGTRVVHCPSSNLRLASGIARVAELLADGVRVALGANSVAANDHLDIFQEMRLAAMIHRVRDGAKAVPARAALELATVGGAQALGLTAVGSIEIGKRADLVLMDLHRPHLFPEVGDLAARLVYAGRASDVHTVLVDGVVKVEAGTLVGVNVETVMQDAQAAAQRLAARIS
jgi:5-methylthioadenosine/S-adenosylhomocysteine deaminase